MDVDLLRPGTVPISPDTILWFEFLLDQSLLLKHLQKPKPDPSPTELIIKFMTSILDSVKNDTSKKIELETSNPECPIVCTNYPDAKPKDSLKNTALKILSLKVAAYIKWDLNVITTLPFKIQTNLFQDLLYFTNNSVPLEILNLASVITDDSISDALLYALTLYHRWIITCISMQRLNTFKSGDCSNPDDTLTYSEEVVLSSVDFLIEIAGKQIQPKVLTYNSFIMLSESNQSVKLDLNQSRAVSTEEMNVYIFHDVAMYYFYEEKYDLATDYFLQCLQCLNKSGVTDLDRDVLDGYLRACNVSPQLNFTSATKSTGLLQQLHNSIADQYTGIVSILQQDNVARQIPQIHRDSLELDIQGALHSGKFTVSRELLPKVQALNVVRRILDATPIFSLNPSPKLVEMLIWAASQLPQESQDKVRDLFVRLIVTDDRNKFITDSDKVQAFLRDVDLELINSVHHQTNDAALVVPDLIRGNTNWLIPEFKNRRLDVRAQEQKAIWCYSPDELRKLINQLAAQSTGRPIWRLNPRWELPIPLQSVLMSLPRGFFQDFGYVLLAKARELQLSKRWDEAQQLLEILEADAVQNGLSKLSKLVDWELLLIKLCRLLVEWPAVSLDKPSLIAQCKACLQALQNGSEQVLPRTEVTEHCVVCLLNMGEWEFVVSLEKRWNYIEIAAAIAYACLDLHKYNGSKRVSRDIWDMVLPMFGPQSNNSGKARSGPSASSPLQNISLQTLLHFLSYLREATALGLVISMLTKLYNILRDEATLELTIENATIWPLLVSNANSYNIKGVMECLVQTVERGLLYYPQNIIWLWLMADINFVNGYHESALRYYLSSLIIQTDYFNTAIPQDDHVFKRMIKSTAALGCHIQAAVLCQFLDESDYSLAFRSLSESKSSHDAMDGYYRCFWDPSILEYLVYTHHKKGEQQRRQRAVQVLGLLELNANNNEEIRREAANIRKTSFLRALAKQYI